MYADETAQGRADTSITIRGVTPGDGFKLATCCHPVPGDRIVGCRKPGESVEVHTLDCRSLASGVDTDWLDLDWGEQSKGAVGRMRATLHDKPGSLAEMAGILARNAANIRALELSQVDHPFGVYELELDVQDIGHFTRILSALRASDVVAQAQRI